MEEKELVEIIKKLKNKIRRLDHGAKELEILIKQASAKITKVEHLKESNNPRERMEYLEALRVVACLKNDLANTNLLITFSLDELEICQEKLKMLENKELSL